MIKIFIVTIFFRVALLPLFTPIRQIHTEFSGYNRQFTPKFGGLEINIET